MTLSKAKGDWLQRAVRLLVSGQFVLWIGSFTALSALMLGILYGFNQYRLSVEREYGQSELLATVLADHATRTLDAVQGTLDAVGEYVGQSDESVWQEQRSQEFLFRLVRGAPYLRSVSVLDEAGLVLGSSNAVNTGTRLSLATIFGPDYRTELPRTTIGRPLAGRDAHEVNGGGRGDLFFIPVALSVRNRGGGTRYVFIALNPAHFANYFEQLVPHPEDAIFLTSYDGVFLAGTGNLAVASGAPLQSLAPFTEFLPERESGRFHVELPGAGSLMASFRASRTWPMLVVSAASRERVLSAWLKSIRLGGSIAVLFVLAITGLTVATWRALLAHKAAQRRLNEQTRLSQERLLQQSEENYHQLFDNASQPIVLVRGGVVLRGNRQAERLGLRCTPEEGSRCHLADFVLPEDRGVFTERLEKSAQGAASGDHFECRFIGDAAPRWMEIVSHLAYWENQPALLVLINDVTDRKDIELKLRESQKLEAIGQLTGGLAHDFNNLLGLVVGNLDRIEESLPSADPAVRHQFDTAREAALRGAAVTRSLLAVARRQPMELVEHDFNQLLLGMMPLLRASLGSGVKFTTKLVPQPLAVQLDAGNLTNAVLNLVLNARDAMQDQPREPSLMISSGVVTIADGSDAELVAGDYAVLEVRDNGGGMPLSVRYQVFDPFFTTKDRDKGTGLGLPMVRGFAEQLGGTVRIDSTEGVGTSVSLYLPCHVPAEAEASHGEALPSVPAGQVDAAPAFPANGDAAQSGRKRVLVVDDEEGLCELACAWLEALGYQATSVLSPEEALRQLEQAQFDYLFTDVVMPGPMDGVALARWTREHYPAMRILLTSGYARSLLSSPALPGALLNKPYRKKDLGNAMAALAQSEA